MIAILYQSQGRADSFDRDRAEILAVSRRNNGELGISGILLTHDQSFIQLLEGPKDSIEALLDYIAGDRRHTDFQVLHRTDIQQAKFAGWSMASYRPDNSLGGGSALDAAIRAVCDGSDPAANRRLYDLIVAIPRNDLLANREH